MNKLDLTALLERVRNATGPDREIDALIEVEVRRIQAYRVGLNDNQRAIWTAWPDGSVSSQGTRYDAGPYTASIDAALALVERVAGGEGTRSMVYSFDLSWHASAHTHMAYTADMFVADGDPCVMLSYQAQSYTLPLAILTALLLALTSNQEGSDEA